jgi:hypothetical protein
VPQVINKNKQEREPQHERNGTVERFGVLYIQQGGQHGGGGFYQRVLYGDTAVAVAALPHQKNIREYGHKVGYAKSVPAVHTPRAACGDTAAGVIAEKERVKKAPEYETKHTRRKYEHYGVRS